jgi:hypothetical protein
MPTTGSSAPPASTIDTAWDRRADGDHLIFETVIVVQEGIVYRTSSDSFTNAGWNHASRAGLIETDFARGLVAEHPDFSGFGSPLTFGYYRGTVASNFAAEHGIDNFSVTVHKGLPGAGVLAFRDTVAFTGSDDALSVVVERLGGTVGPASATLVSSHCSPGFATLTWADGDGAPRSVAVTCSSPNGCHTETVRLEPVSGAPVHPHRDQVAIIVAPTTWDPALLALGQFFDTLLSGFSPAWVVALAVPAALLAARKRRRPAGHTRSDRSAAGG